MKPWYKSKTNWLNIGGVAATIVAAAAELIPGLQGIMTVETYIYLNVFVNAANLVLRNYLTGTKIG